MGGRLGARLSGARPKGETQSSWLDDVRLDDVQARAEGLALDIEQIGLIDWIKREKKRK